MTCSKQISITGRRSIVAFLLLTFCFLASGQDQDFRLDSCIYCQRIKHASLNGNADSSRSFLFNCTIRDTINYLGITRSDTVLYAVLSIEKCTSDSTLRFYLKDLRYQRIIAFCLYEDSKSRNIPITFPDLNRIPKSRIVCDLVDQLPYFPGGQVGLDLYLKSNLQYPPMAKDVGIQGVSYVRFTIDETGKVGSVATAKGIGGGCDEEAIRLVKLMPKWIPAIRNGMPVSVNYQLPIVFALD